MKKLDKMDIIVILLTGMALYYFIFVVKPAPKAAPQVDAKSEVAKAADGTPKVEGPTTTTTEAPPVPPAEKEELVEFATPAAKYIFTTAGGGIKSLSTEDAPYAGRTIQELNLKGEGPIGSISKIEGEVDTKPWSIKEKTAKSITFETTTKDGIVITKHWSQVAGAEPLKGPGYLWDLQVSFQNNSTETFTPDAYSIYVGADTQVQVLDQYVLVGLFASGKGQEISVGAFDQSKALGFLWVTQPARSTISQTMGQAAWVSVNSQYYSTIVTSMAPEKLDAKMWARRFEDKIKDGDKDVNVKGIHAGFGLPATKIEAGKAQSFNYQVYTGPRSGTLLGKIEQDRVETMFYGAITGGLSKLFIWALNAFYGLTSSFGLAVVFLTLCVRIVIWPLHIKATRSMKRMGLLAPMMTEIKEKYKAKTPSPETQRAQQMEMMGLYREYGINPLGGCLPLLLQMPIFFGYFGMLNHAVEMRGHSFLWAHDLTLPDTVFHVLGFPINPLPLLMTITMFIQMKLQPTPPSTDENQKLQMKIMKFMPIMFLLFCYSYASALALYWTVQNIVSIFQTQLVKRMPEPELTKRDPRKLPPTSGSGRFGGGSPPEKPKTPGPPRIGGGGKSAFKG